MKALLTDLSGLNALLKAQSKQMVDKLINLTFITRHTSRSKEMCVETMMTLLELDERQEAIELHSALLECIRVTLLSGQVESLAELLNGERGVATGALNAKLKPLIGQIVTQRLDGWREAAAEGRVQLPRLVGVDWAVHLQQASSEVASMQGRPSVRVALAVEDQPTHVEPPTATNAHSSNAHSSNAHSCSTMPAVHTVEFTLQRETLETVIDGLGKIRDQLSSMG